MRILGMLFFIGLGSCSGPVDPIEPELCKVSVESTWPTNGSTTAHYRQDIEFQLSAAVEEASIVTDVPGMEWMREDGMVVGFTPSAHLEPNKNYDFGLSYCGGEPHISFTTSAHGLQVADLENLAGSTYFADLNSIRFTSGGGVAEILLSIFDRAVLVQVLEARNDSISFRFSVAKADTTYPEQDTCYRTLDQEGVDFGDNPLFSHATEVLQFDAFLAQLSLRDLILEGSVSPDGLSLAGIKFEVSLDVREVTDMMGVDDYAEVCELAGTLGTDCVICAHDGVAACIEVAGTGLTASAVNLDLLDIPVENVHEDCEKAEEE